MYTVTVVPTSRAAACFVSHIRIPRVFVRGCTRRGQCPVRDDVIDPPPLLTRVYFIRTHAHRLSSFSCRRRGDNRPSLECVRVCEHLQAYRRPVQNRSFSFPSEPPPPPRDNTSSSRSRANTNAFLYIIYCNTPPPL